MKFYSPETRDALAAHIKIELDQKVAVYEQKCRKWADKGYRPKYCYHGTFLWVDYSPACEQCEMGDDWEDTHARSVEWADRALIQLESIECVIADTSLKITGLRIDGVLSDSQKRSMQEIMTDGFLSTQKRILWGLTKRDLVKMVFSNKEDRTESIFMRDQCEPLLRGLPLLWAHAHYEEED